MSVELSRRAVLLGSGAALAAATVPFAAGEARAATAPPYPGTLRYGSTGGAVRSLQQALSSSGFWLGAVDGSFGALTQQAVFAIQKAYGAARTGVVGADTWARAFSMRRPLGRYSTTGIEIHLQRQLLFVMNGPTVQWAFNTSTGNGSVFPYLGGWARAITPTGTFRIYRKSATEGSSGWVSGPLGEMYRPRFFTTDGIAIHGSTSIPAYPASHGCCRLTTAAQNYLLGAGRLNIGTTVRIY